MIKLSEGVLKTVPMKIIKSVETPIITWKYYWNIIAY